MKGQYKMTKTQLINELSDQTGLSRQQIASVLEELSGVISQQLATEGNFTLPSLLKITKKHIPEKAERVGKNPFTGEQTVFKAKPAHDKIQIRALKALKEMA